MDRKTTLYVGALAKGVRVLKAFDDAHPELSLTALVARTGLDKSAVQRLTHTLHAEGMLEKDEVTRRYRPSHMWLQMAYAYYWSDPLVPLALPKLIELSRDLGETVNLAELSGDHIIYISRLPVKRTEFAATVVGRRLPAISTAAGRAILSTFPVELRVMAAREWPCNGLTPRADQDRALIAEAIEAAVQDGYSITRDQMILNEIAIAAPIRGADGRAVGAAQCSVSAHSWDEATIKRDILPLLQDVANSIAPGGAWRR